MTTVAAPAGTGTPAAPAPAPTTPAAPVNTTTQRLYEGMILVDPILAAKEWDKVNAHIAAILAKNKADLKSTTKWVERKLAYAIKRQRRGTYVLLYFVAPMSAIPGIRRECEISEMILRALFIAHPLAKEVPNAPPPPPPLKEYDDSRPTEAGRFRPRRPM